MRNYFICTLLLLGLFSCKKYETDRADFNPPNWIKGKWEASNGRTFEIDRGIFIDSEFGTENQINGSIEYLEEKKRKEFKFTLKDQRSYRFDKNSDVEFRFQNLKDGASTTLTEPVKLKKLL